MAQIQAHVSLNIVESKFAKNENIIFNLDINITSEVGQVMQLGIVVQHEPSTRHPGQARQGHCQVSQHHDWSELDNEITEAVVGQ